MTTPPPKTPAYHVQHGPTIDAIASFVASTARSVELPVDKTKFLTSGLIEHGEITKFTRGEINAGMQLVFENCRADGPQACSVLPEKATKQSILNALKHGYSYGKGGIKHAKSLVMYSLGKHRKANRSRRNASELAAAVKAKVTVTYNGKQYATEELARKAGCRDAHGKDWWKTDKDERLAAIKLG